MGTPSSAQRIRPAAECSPCTSGGVGMAYSGPAVGRAAGRRHLVEEVDVGGHLGHHDERLGGAAQHGRELRRRRERGRQLVRVRHAHHEVDVGQVLLQRRHLLDVVERHRPPVAWRPGRGSTRQSEPVP